MKVPTVGWAFFGLAVLVLAGYVLNRGIFIGSDVRQSTFKYRDGSSEQQYVKHCRYLHFTGIEDDAFWAKDSYERADSELCRMFDQ